MIRLWMIQDRMTMVKFTLSLSHLHFVHFDPFSDDSDPNPKRKKPDEVNETLVRIPLNRG